VTMIILPTAGWIGGVFHFPLLARANRLCRVLDHEHVSQLVAAGRAVLNRHESLGTTAIAVDLARAGRD
jgi:hypothetical protein